MSNLDDFVVVVVVVAVAVAVAVLIVDVWVSVSVLLKSVLIVRCRKILYRAKPVSECRFQGVFVSREGKLRAGKKNACLSLINRVIICIYNLPHCRLDGILKYFKIP